MQRGNEIGSDGIGRTGVSREGGRGGKNDRLRQFS